MEAGVQLIGAYLLMFGLGVLALGLGGILAYAAIVNIGGVIGYAVALVPASIAAGSFLMIFSR